MFNRNSWWAAREAGRWAEPGPQDGPERTFPVGRAACAQGH